MRKWLALAALVIGLDQASKLAAEHWLVKHESVPLIPFFKLTLSYNEGAAFSFLADSGGWQRWFFSILAVAISVFLVNWLRQLGNKDRWLSASLSLVLGGAIGNLIDRLAYGHVVDFLHLYYQGWSWPVFNIADTAITLGVASMIIHMVVVKPQPTEAS